MCSHTDNKDLLLFVSHIQHTAIPPSIDVKLKTPRLYLTRLSSRFIVELQEYGLVLRHQAFLFHTRKDLFVAINNSTVVDCYILSVGQLFSFRVVKIEKLKEKGQLVHCHERAFTRLYMIEYIEYKLFCCKPVIAHGVLNLKCTHQFTYSKTGVNTKRSNPPMNYRATPQQ